MRSIGKKGDDCGDDEAGVKEGGVLATAKAAKPGGDDSKDDDDNDNKEGQKDVKKCIMGQKGCKKRAIDVGDDDDINNNNIIVWQKSGKKCVVNDGNDDNDDNDNKEGQKGVKKRVMWCVCVLTWSPGREGRFQD